MRSLSRYITLARFTRLSGCGESIVAIGRAVTVGREGVVEVGQVEEEDAALDAVAMLANSASICDIMVDLMLFW